MHKFGKADLNRVTQSTQIPTRIHQQVRQLSNNYGKGAVQCELIMIDIKTTQAAKAHEIRQIAAYAKANKARVRRGNERSYKPKSTGCGK